MGTFLHTVPYTIRYHNMAFHHHKTLITCPPLLCDHDPEQLVLQSLWCDHEVEQRHLRGELRQVVGVAKLGRDVEAEVSGVLNGVVT